MQQRGIHVVEKRTLRLHYIAIYRLSQVEMAKERGLKFAAFEARRRCRSLA